MSVKLDKLLINTIFSGNLQIDIVRENMRYSTWDGASYSHHGGVYTPSGAAYAQIKSIPAGRQRATLTDTNEHIGAWSIILRYPTGANEFVAKTAAEAVLALFPVGTKMTYEDISAWIESSRRDEGVIVAGYYQISITINYTAYIGA